MQIFSGSVEVYTGRVTPSYYSIAGKVRDHYMATLERKSGVTMVYLEPFDMTRIAAVGQPLRYYSFYSHINGNTQADGASGSSIWISYQMRSRESGASWVFAPNKLRTSGTSVSGSSGSALTQISEPVTAAQWRLVFAYKKSNTTADMVVDYSLMVE